MGRKRIKRVYENNRQLNSVENSSSESSSSSDSSFSDLSNDEKLKKRKKKSSKLKNSVRVSSKINSILFSVVKYIKSFKNKEKIKTDIFQQNIKVKLNHLENMMRNIIENQTKILAKLDDRSETSNPAKPKRNFGEKPAIEVVINHQQLEEEPDIKHFIEFETPVGTLKMPNFPMTDLNIFYKFDIDLHDINYRKEAVALATQFLCGSHDSLCPKMRRLMYSLMSRNLLNNFSWSGSKKNSKAVVKRSALR